MPFIRRLLSHKRAMPVFIRQFMSPLRDLYDSLCRIKPKYGIKSDTPAYRVYISQMVNKDVKGGTFTLRVRLRFKGVWGEICRNPPFFDNLGVNLHPAGLWYAHTFAEMYALGFYLCSGRPTR
jgi:hypothetical protein